MEAKRLRTVLATAATLAVGSVAIASAAPGDVVLSGSTAEGVKVKLTVAEFGNATAFKISKTRVKCERGGTLSNRATTYTGFDTSDPGSFFDKRKTSSTFEGFHFKTKSTLNGHVDADPVSWSGSLKLVTRVFQHHEKIDTCKLKTTWDAA
jgi:hypothetical protein